MSGLSQVSQARMISGLSDSRICQRLSFLDMMLWVFTTMQESLFFFSISLHLLLGVEHNLVASNDTWLLLTVLSSCVEISVSGFLEAVVSFNDTSDVSDEESWVIFCESHAGHIQAKLWSLVKSHWSFWGFLALFFRSPSSYWKWWFCR